MIRKTRTRICLGCKQSFTYEVGKGRDRKHCSPECRERYKVARRIPKSEWSLCSTAGCERTVRMVGAALCNRCYQRERKSKAGICHVHKCTALALRSANTLCEKHYTRMRRTGTFDVRKPMYRYVTGAGYIKLYEPAHPMADTSGYVFEHRKVAYDRDGEGPHHCYWCAAPLNWTEAVVDHLNEDKANNRPHNLVVACTNCNRARGAVLPFLKGMRNGAVETFLRCMQELRSA